MRANRALGSSWLDVAREADDEESKVDERVGRQERSMSARRARSTTKASECTAPRASEAEAAGGCAEAVGERWGPVEGGGGRPRSAKAGASRPPPTDAQRTLRGGRRRSAVGGGQRRPARGGRRRFEGADAGRQRQAKAGARRSRRSAEVRRCPQRARQGGRATARARAHSRAGGGHPLRQKPWSSMLQQAAPGAHEGGRTRARCARAHHPSIDVVGSLRRPRWAPGPLGGDRVGSNEPRGCRRPHELAAAAAAAPWDCGDPVGAAATPCDPTRPHVLRSVSLWRDLDRRVLVEVSEARLTNLVHAGFAFAVWRNLSLCRPCGPRMPRTGTSRPPPRPERP